MRPSAVHGLPSRRIHSSFSLTLLLDPLVFLLLFSLTLSNSFCLADDEEKPKAIRRGSAEASGSIRDQRRVALVIGNSKYEVGPLKNPAHDAEDTSDALRRLGFAVDTKMNVNQREMEEAVNEFVQKIQNGDVALFYFSGHGVQVRGENYLIPIGASIGSEPDVRYKTVNAGLILAKMEDSRNRANIVILDACRNNPFKGLFRSPSMGLSKMDAPKGTFIAYATSPDSVAADGAGRNSPYTKHLVEALTVKDIPIELTFKQVGRAVNQETAGQQTPWTSSSLMDDFYFNPSSPTFSLGKPSDGGRTENEQQITKPGGAETAESLEMERLEKAKREQEQEISRLREAERVAALEKQKLEKQKLERELREREQELAKLKEERRLSALEKERIERETRERETGMRQHQLQEQQLRQRQLQVEQLRQMRLRQEQAGKSQRTATLQTESIEREKRQSNTATAPSVEGTTWRWPSPSSSTVQFLKDGQVSFNDSVYGGHWEQIGNSVKFDSNGFTLFEVTITGNKMKGIWRRLKGQSESNSTELIRVQQ
jgi:hypothetical protein